MPTTREIAWLAGLLEGEGCFQMFKSSSPKKGTPIIALNMTDQDIVQRAAALLDGCTPKATPRFAKDGHALKTMYNTRRCGGRALGWMLTLYPFLGVRRRSKIREIVAQWQSIRPTKRPYTIGDKRFCSHGHELTPANTNTQNRCRVCRNCRRRLDREAKERMKAKRRARGLLDSHGRPRLSPPPSLPFS